MGFKDFRFVMVVLIVVLTIGVGFVTAVDGGQGPVREVRLNASDPVPDAEFGRSVAIDGNLAAVGAGGADAGTVAKAGAVYLYKRQGQDYVYEEKLVAPDASKGAEFGRAVAIQGNMVIVGARFAQVGELDKAGAAYIYRSYGGMWHFEQKITSPIPANEDNFGRALAVQGDTLVVTARKEKTTADDVGAAYVYVFRDGDWVFHSKINASDPASNAYFGQSVALSGNVMAVGARNADPNGAGAVYLYRRAGDDWIEVTKVTPEDGEQEEQYGFCIAVAGNTIAVGARRDNLTATKAGAVYVYSIKGDSVDLVAKLTANDAEKGDEFGQSVAFAGEILAIGAWKDDKGEGSIYLFRQIGNQWVQIDKIQASDGSAGDEFGYSLAAFGNHLVTGAHFADSKAGTAYVIPVRL